MHCLVKNGQAYEDSSLLDVIRQAVDFKIDFTNRIMYIDGVADTITYSPVYTLHEMEYEMLKRALILLQRSGWNYYKSNKSYHCTL